MIVVAVDPDGSGLERARNLMRAANIVGPDRSGEAVGRVVALQDRVVLVLERNHRGDGSEDLLARDPHVVLHVGEDGRIDEVALAVRTVTAERRLRAFLLADARDSL